jgi:type IV fimbrial biogenesis protein FimT
MLSRRQQGVTLLELMMSIVLLGLLLAMGLPSFSSWIRDTHNRTAAESVLNGLQLARNEAVRRNTLVRFTLTDAEGKVSWNVGCVNASATCPATIQSRPAADGSNQARIGVNTDPIASPAPAGLFDTPLAAGSGIDTSAPGSGVTFNGFGRVPSGNVGDDITRADVTNVASTSARRYVVLVGTGGQIRMCDPKRSFSSDPQGCS